LTEACCAANATGLIPPSGGMKFPTVEYDDMASKFRPTSDGGILQRCGTVEVPSNYHRDGTPVKRHLRWGVFISVKALSDYAAGFLTDFRNENRMMVDTSGHYGIMYRPTHILGLELNKSIASVALLGLPTGCPKTFVADMIAVAKRDLRRGEMLDGPGAYTTYGQLVPAEESLRGRFLPTGFSENVKVIRPVAKDSILTYDDVEIDKNMFSYKLRKAIEAGSI
jgi:predicted homoserine dehydrogenase-like protein